jgi:replicative DNA helicase
MIERIPPQNLEAEQNLLGALLIDDKAIIRVLEIIKPDSFYKQSHKDIFSAMLSLYKEEKPIDIISVSDFLLDKDRLEIIGGRQYVNDLAFSVFSSANIEYYSEIVHKNSILRSLVKLGAEIQELSYESKDTENVLNFASSSIGNIMNTSTVENKTFSFSDVVNDLYTELEIKEQNKNIFTGVPSGFYDLDNLTGGFDKGQYVIVAGRPSMGKTAFALNIATNISKKETNPALIFSIEMSKESLIKRIVSSETNINSMKLKNAGMISSEWESLAGFLGKSHEYNLIINDKAGISVEEITAKSKEMHLKYGGLSVIVIDYIGLIESKGKSKEIREQEVARISRTLKNLARNLQVPVIALSQLSRLCEARADKRPMLSDLRESGSIEQDADIVMFVYRDEYYNPDKQDNKGKAEIIIAKQREGQAGVTVDLLFEGRTTTFKNKSGVLK